MTARREALRGRLGILAAAALFSTGGAAIKYCSLGAWQVAGFRAALATVFLLIVLPEARRGWTWQTMLVGTVQAATMILFVAANKLTTAANTIFLQATAPLFVLLLSPWLLKERARRHDVLFMLMLALGLVVFFVGTPPSAQTAPNPALGNLLALASGVLWALTIMGLRWTATSGGAGSAVVAANAIACVACAPFAFPVTALTAGDLLALLFLGTVQIGIAYLLVARCARHVPALETSLLLLLEPVLNPVWAFLIQGERPGRLAVFGGAVIVAATAWHALVSRASPR